MPAQSDRGVIAATKLQIPLRRRELVPRAALVAEMTAASERKLTLLTAPPGAGKTTLLVEWHLSVEEPRPFAWLSLDRDDTDPVRFWGGVIEALRTVRPGGFDQAAGSLSSPGSTLTGVVIPLLINELVDSAEPLVLVLDDYHTLDSPEIHDSVRFLLERMPAQLHLAIATRFDPPLPLGRMRARGELVEIRAADLRFTESEAGELLNRGLGLTLAPKQIAQLTARTEGWAAALQLAGVSLRGREKPEEFIADFAGDDRHVVDYLVSEVLEAEDEDTRKFLVHTAILERLSGPLCDAVTGGSGSDRVLEELDARNLFTIPLDDSRHWYRYHQLFTELLRHELQRSEHELAPELHRRACAWYSEHGHTPEAIAHALAGSDLDAAAKLVAVNWSDYFNRGWLTTVSQWLDSLPVAWLRGDSRLWLARAWTSMDLGRHDEVRDWLARVDDVDVEDTESLRAWAALLGALHLYKTGDVGGAAAAIAPVAEAPDQRSVFWRTVACCVVGVTSYWTGRRGDAAEAFAEGVDVALADGNTVAAAYCLGYLGVIGGDEHDPRDAGEPLEKARTLFRDEPQLEEHFTALAFHLARARLAEASPNGSNPIAEAERAVELSRRGAGILEQAWALLTLGHHLAAGGDAAAGRAALEEARAAIDGCNDPGLAGQRLEAAERELGTPPPAVHRHTAGDELSEREIGVLRLLRSELSLREIGDELFVSTNTVKTHVRNIYLKLGVGSREEAVARGRGLGLV
jgi:LuxR family transcriptional regulator, maltose regulon positive regulatory protein